LSPFTVVVRLGAKLFRTMPRGISIPRESAIFRVGASLRPPEAYDCSVVMVC
jgi:hypothetical protein